MMITSLHLGDVKAASSCPRPHPSTTFDLAAGLQPIISHLDVLVRSALDAFFDLAEFFSCFFFFFFSLI